MSTILAEEALLGLSYAQRAKYFKYGAWTSFAQEKGIEYGYNRVRKANMAYRTNYNRYSARRPRQPLYLQRRSRGGRRLMNRIESMDTLPTIGAVRKIVYDGKAKKVEVYANNNAAINTNNLWTHQIGSGIATGVSRGDRIGDSVKLTHLRVELTFYNPNQNNSIMQHCTVRLFCLKNKRPTDTDVGSQLFESISDSNTPVDFTTTNSPQQLNLQFNKNKHVVYFDRRVRVLQTANGAAGENFQRRVYNIPLSAIMKFNQEPLAADSILPNIRFGMFVQRDDIGANALLSASLKYQIKISTHYT